MVGFNLFNEFQGHKVENECLFHQDNDHHVFTQFDILDQLVSIEGNLSPIFLLMVVPYNHFVSLVCVNEHYDVGLVHHLNNAHLVFEVLNLLL